MKALQTKTTSPHWQAATPPSDPSAWLSDSARAFDARYETSPAFIQRRQVWREAIERHTEPCASVLDAGCGTGVLAFLAAARCRQVLGIDASREMIELCREKKDRARSTNTEFDVLRLEQLPDHVSQSFDLVMCSSVLEYVADFWRAVDSLASRLAPRGTMLFSVPNTLSVYRLCERTSFAMIGKPAYFGHVRNVLSPWELASGLNSRGLGTIATHYYGLGSLLVEGLGTHKRVGPLALYICRRQGSRHAE